MPPEDIVLPDEENIPPEVLEELDRKEKSDKELLEHLPKVSNFTDGPGSDGDSDR